MADTESDSDEEDAAYVEGEEKDPTRLPNDYRLQGGSNEVGDSMDGTPPSVFNRTCYSKVIMQW